MDSVFIWEPTQTSTADIIEIYNDNLREIWSALKWDSTCQAFAFPDSCTSISYPNNRSLFIMRTTVVIGNLPKEGILFYLGDLKDINGMSAKDIEIEFLRIYSRNITSFENTAANIWMIKDDQIPEEIKRSIQEKKEQLILEGIIEKSDRSDEILDELSRIFNS